VQVAEEAKRLWRDVKFNLARKRLLAPPGAPHFDVETHDCFTRLIERADVYVEYGSGGATLLAADHASLVVSVESDRHYRHLVQKALDAAPRRGRVELIHGRIGPTAEWGNPILRVDIRAVSGRHYATAPWSVLERAGGRRADLILIDGRYRMACALGAMLSPLGRDAPMLIDDFEGRASYQELLDFVDVIERPGRSILARAKSSLDRAHVAAAFERYVRDWR
jgi:hypothetical protein